MKKLAPLAILALLAIVALTAQTQKPTGTSGRASADEAAVMTIENSWPDAVIKKDIDDIKNGVFVVESANATDLTPRIYGNAAVVTGVGEIKGTYKDQDITGRYRFTDTFVKKNGQWQCVATQTTKIVDMQ